LIESVNQEWKDLWKSLDKTSAGVDGIDPDLDPEINSG